MDIVDRLITYVEYRGIHEVTNNMDNIVASLIKFKDAGRNMQAAFITASAANQELLRTLNQYWRFKTSDSFLFTYEKRYAAFTEATLAATEAAYQFGNMMKMSAGIGVIAVTALNIALAETNKQYEEAQAKLSGLYRSDRIGAESVGFLKAYSEKGPNNFQQNATDLVRLVAEGINPTELAMRITQAVGFVQGQSPGDIARVIGRAALGQTRSLRQLGVGMEDIKAFDPGNVGAKNQFRNVAKAQEDIEKLLAIRYAGSLEYIDKLLVSHMNRMKSSWSNMLESLEELTGTSNFLKTSLDILSETFWVITKIVNILALVINAPFLFLFGAIDLIVDGLSHLMPFLKPVLSFFDGIAERFANFESTVFKEFFGTSKLSKIPPWLQHSNLSDSSSMSHIIREVLGGGAIAKIGIRASELPGIGARKNNVIKVDISHVGDADLKKFLERLVGEVLGQAVKHNAFPQP